jgi:hypothetical protein
MPNMHRDAHNNCRLLLAFSAAPPPPPKKKYLPHHPVLPDVPLHVTGKVSFNVAWFQVSTEVEMKYLLFWNATQ